MTCAHGARWECGAREQELKRDRVAVSAGAVGPSARLLCLYTHRARWLGGGSGRRAGEGRARASERGRGGKGGGGAQSGAGPSLPSIVYDWLARGAGAGRRVLGDNLGVSHLSIVFAAAVAL